MKGLVWLASFPRSGNTYLRTVLAQCFGLKSGSLYLNDLGNDPALERLVGHIEHENGRVEFSGQPQFLIKTHGTPQDRSPAIYVLRDGRDAMVSLFHYSRGRAPMLDLVEGRTAFGTWAAHVNAWKPYRREQTLLIRYEDLVHRLDRAIDQVAEFLGVDPIARSLPPRDEIAKDGNRWIRGSDAERVTLEGEALRRFWEINGETMAAYGYAEKG